MNMGTSYAFSSERVRDERERRAAAETRPGAEVTLDEWVAPDLADQLGHLRAGSVLEWMDVSGVLAATRHCREAVVTASVDALTLHRPIAIGQHLTMTAVVGYTSARSMGVTIALFADGEPVGDGYMTFVALGADGRAVQVPSLAPETATEHERWRQGQVRREFRQRAVASAPVEATPLSTALHRIARWPAELLTRRTLERPARQRSLIHKIEPVFAGTLNFRGTLYGGAVMRWLETSAGLSARAFLGGSGVEFIDTLGLEFEKPVRAHTFVHIHAQVVHVGEGVTVYAELGVEDPIAGAQGRAVRGYFRYRRADRRARPIPALSYLTESDRLHLAEVEARLALERSLRLG